jgi:hypothetical protein
MARKKKEEDLFIQRVTPATVERAINDGEKKVYYYTEGDKYVVWDLRGKTPVMTTYESAEEVMKKVV